MVALIKIVKKLFKVLYLLFLLYYKLYYRTTILRHHFSVPVSAYIEAVHTLV